MIEGSLGVLAMLVLALCRIPLGFAMGLVGFVGLALVRSPNAAKATVTNIIFDTGFQYTLAVIPLFVLMGNFVVRSGISKELYDTANAFVGHRKGGLAMATILACAGFGSICGSAIATAATMTKVAHPPMKGFGYSDRLSTGSIAAGGTLGILIPPSVVMIIYCILTEQNIGAMFAAGVLPGLVAVVFYVLAIRYVVWRDPSAGPAAQRMPWGERLRVARGVWSVILLFAVVMGGIYSGLFTSTESAGIGAFGALLFAIFKGRLSLSEIRDTVVESAVTASMLFIIVMGAFLFSAFINFTSLPGELTAFVQGLDVSPVLVVTVICVMYILLGIFLEELSVVLLTVPLLFPIVSAVGVDPIWFGILVVCTVQIGMISPPIGMNLFVISAMLPQVPTKEVWRGVLPFFVADLLRLAVLILVPSIVTILPRLMGL